MEKALDFFFCKSYQVQKYEFSVIFFLPSLIFINE